MILRNMKESRLNSSFNPLTFTKLRFWLLKKKTTKRFLSFASVAVLPPKTKKIKKITRGTLSEVPPQRRPSQNWHWRPKLPQMQNVGGCFIVFFLGGQNYNFVKVKGLKLQLSQESKVEVMC